MENPNKTHPNGQTPVTICVDAMGGDRAPEVNLDGAVEALAKDKQLKIVLVGPEEQIKSELARRSVQLSDRLEVAHAREIISMEDHGAAAIRKKKESSIHVGLKWLKEGRADAFISAGNSGAVMAGATLLLGRIRGVERPAIVVKLPTAEGFITVLDAGANVDCKPSHMAQFAEMGHIFSQVIDKVETPRIALLSNGTESHKGNEATRETHQLLQERKDIHYLGYVEGYDLFRGVADVIVCDGFVGNVTLKLTEGLADTAFRWFRQQIRQDWLGLLGVVLMQRTLKRFKNKFDYQPYGAAPLLGIDGMVMISHGGSTKVAIRNGIFTAARGVRERFIEEIRDRLPGRGTVQNGTENDTGNENGPDKALL